MSSKLIGCKAAVIVTAVIVAGVLGGAPAMAGTLTLNVNPNANGSGCSMFSVSSSSIHFGYGCPGWAYPMSIFYFSGPASVPAGARIAYETDAPAGITINSASASPASIDNINTGQGWGGGSYWAGGGNPWTDSQTYLADGPFNSSYWGFQIICGWSSCSNGAGITLNTIQLSATENQGPGLLAIGSNNLWYQGSHYIWNAPGDPWPLTLNAADPSGVCNMWAYVNNHQLPGPSATPDTSAWQQCPQQTWTAAGGASVDSRDYIPTAGQLTLGLNATNAAQVTSSVAETLNVDNDPVGVSLRTPNDPNPSVWVNHAVTVDAAVSAGPSGVGGVNCAAGSGSATAYPAGGVTVDGDGVHTVSCTGWNRATDPEGSPATGTSSIAVHIDEAPPSLLSFEPQNPSDPTGLIVDTSDSESGVQGGSVEMAPAGSSSWTSVPTSFDGQHLLAHFDDAGLSGDYTFRATSCDNVGNCASTSETMALPVRLGTSSDVSFAKIVNPLRAEKVKERVRVGWHWAAVLRHGRAVKVKRGGHMKTITVIRLVERCTRKRIRTAKHHWTVHRSCRAPKIALVSSLKVAYGKPVTVHGLLVTSQDVPISGTAVRILTAPDNQLGQFTQAATVTTGADGSWSATLPAGPSRIVQAVYGGSQMLLPATGQAIVNVPARIGLSISPREIAWTGTITLHGHLEGGYVPPDGVSLRLLVRYPGSPRGSVLLGFRINARGTFEIKWSYHAGRGVASYPLWIATTATESDYPFSASASRRIRVTFGRQQPVSSPHPEHHKRHRKRRRR
jgi:hypothetical protein